MNWKPIIKELAVHMQQKDIAAAVGLSPAMISELKTGDRGSVEYSKGVALMELHRRVLRNARKLAAKSAKGR